MGLHKIYRLNAAILAIHSEFGKRTPILVPSGALVSVADGPLDERRMIDVLWEDQTVMMFAVDLRDRGTLIRSVRTESAVPA